MQAVYADFRSTQELFVQAHLQSHMEEAKAGGSWVRWLGNSTPSAPNTQAESTTEINVLTETNMDSKEFHLTKFHLIHQHKPKNNQWPIV